MVHILHHKSKSYLHRRETQFLLLFLIDARDLLLLSKGLEDFLVIVGNMQENLLDFIRVPNSL